MDSYEKLPDAKITPSGKISEKFLELGINNFKGASDYIYELEYGYNSTYDDEMILFKEKKGTCTTKHAIIAGLAEELSIPLSKNVGVYKFTEKISSGTDRILETYKIPYVPMVHCFLVYKNYKFDLTEGNNNGKKKNPQEFIAIKEVEPFISRKDEYLWFKRILKEKVLPSKEMKGTKEKTLLKAREEAIELLKKNIK
ncbi:MAG: hypothetical protein BAJALOKI2v1_620001 [Promethearchaeota archaeon]|nr:MAG: hypothetical protein BAJALOKI2v1_620001 [Candidatus Lokiarchaeota archaeon]